MVRANSNEDVSNPMLSVFISHRDHECCSSLTTRRIIPQKRTQKPLQKVKKIHRLEYGPAESMGVISSLLGRLI